MDWYFAEGGRAVGPLPEEDFQQLVRQGRVTASTLVWNERLTQWQSYGQLLAAAGVADRPGGVSICSQCGRVWSVDDMIHHAGAWVCAECKEVYFQRLREGVTAPATPVGAYAGFWIRLVAVLIDWVILWAVQMAVNTGMTRMLTPMPGAAWASFVFLLLVAYGIPIAYETYFIGRFGATAGKMACGLRVVVADGSRVSYLRAFARFFAKALSNLTLMIGYVIAAFDSEKRALHDHLCSTRVVRVRRAAP